VFFIYTQLNSCLYLLYEIYHFYFAEQMDSNDEVQEIDPPVIIHSRHKGYRRKILKEELDIHFYRRGKRNKQDVEDTKDQDHNTDLNKQDMKNIFDQDQNANLDFIKNSIETDIDSR
jgi:hypothetical protein